jgi:multiple sugar transport system ATP-binding protein
VRDPQCFLFDEPLSNLDAKLRVETRAELKRLHQRLATTTIYVTHDQEEAMSLGDRVVVMKDGLVQQCDAPLAIYQHPVNRFVAGFVGTPSMNFLQGTLVRGESGWWFDQGEQKVRLADQIRDQLADRVDQPIVLGIRPEAISDEPAGRFAGEDNALSCVVNVVEPLGAKMDLYLTTLDDSPLIARVDAHSGIEPGSKQRYYVDMQRAHLFEPGENGANLALAGQTA